LGNKIEQDCAAVALFARRRLARISAKASPSAVVKHDHRFVLSSVE
jgi:hypothetical protein